MTRRVAIRLAPQIARLRGVTEEEFAQQLASIPAVLLKGDENEANGHYRRFGAASWHQLPENAPIAYLKEYGFAESDKGKAFIMLNPIAFMAPRLFNLQDVWVDVRRKDGSSERTSLFDGCALHRGP
jgi:hypothetical protein